LTRTLPGATQGLDEAHSLPRLFPLTTTTLPRSTSMFFPSIIRTRAAAVLVVALVAAGCATTKTTTEGYGTGGRLAKPGRILVYNFAATAADLDADTQGTQDGSGSVDPKTLEVGRELGAEIAARLVDEIDEMGLNAEVGNGAAPPAVGDIVIRGHFTSIDEGSAAKRVMIGFGSGKAEVKIVVEGFVRTAEGLRKVGGGTVDSAGGKGPGAAVPLLVTVATANPIGLAVSGAVKAEGELSGRTTVKGAGKRAADEIAERMKARFKSEGWI
jgi:hypothetical protein